VTRLVGIHREREYSPGRHQSNDPQLLEQVAGHLRERGFAVDLGSIEQADRVRRDATLVFSMCQGRVALDRLAAWEREGAQIVNHPAASLNTYRDRLPALMQRAGVPFPPTEIVATTGPLQPAMPGPEGPVLQSLDRGVWLKRGDVHASVSADVQWIDSASALERGRAEFASRGITAATVQEHCPGDEIKFYGVAGGAFLHWLYAGSTRGHAFNPSALASLVARAGTAAGLEIFGGDVIVSPAGALTLIDLNDWPSFAPCRDAAADAIATYLARRAHAVWNPDLVSSANESAV
jgi:hypothetical protein